MRDKSKDINYWDKRWGGTLTTQQIRDRKALWVKVMDFKKIFRNHTELMKIVDNGGIVRFTKNPNTQGNVFLNKLRDYFETKV
jgi:hypothetical protein